MSGARMVMVITTLAASAALVAGATAASQAGGGYKILGKFGQTGTGNGQFATASNGIAIDGAGVLYIADTDNNRVRRLAPGPDGLLLTIAGVPAAPGPVSPPGGFGGDGGPATGAALNQPSAVANGPDGSLLIVDRDTLSCPTEDLASTRVLRTVFAGDVVYDAGFLS